MANEEEDLFEEEFDFVDEDDSEVEENSAEEDAEEDAEVEEEEPTNPKRRSAKASDSKGGGKRGAKKSAAAEDDEGNKEDAEVEAEPEEAVEPPGPPADHVVHVYEYGNFKRTIQREFTDEDSIKFAEEFNRTSKAYSRRAVPDHRDEKPDPHL